MSNPRRRLSELRYRALIRFIEVVGLIVHRAVPWAGITAVAYFAYLSIRTLSGEHTVASLVVKFVADFNIKEGVSYVVGLTGIGVGLRYRKLRKDTLEHMGERIKELESQIDPKRSSSRLTRRGETRPEDLP
jgi:hypothetical protein